MRSIEEKGNGFLNCSYNPHQNFISNHLEWLNRHIDKHSNSFDNFIFIGEYNVSTNHNLMINFCDLNILRNLINVPRCCKHFDNPTSIHLILSSRQSYVQHSAVFETGLSDFHLLTITELKFSKTRAYNYQILWLQKLWQRKLNTQVQLWLHWFENF